MKTSEITVGTTYHDGKVGVRKVVAIKGQVVTYQLLSAKAEKGWSIRTGTVKNHIGTESEMMLNGFSRWAKSAHDDESAEELLNSIAARKLKLSPGELAFMESVRCECGRVLAGVHVTYDHAESRAVSGLSKKGCLIKMDGEVSITKLGAAWFA